MGAIATVTGHGRWEYPIPYRGIDEAKGELMAAPGYIDDKQRLQRRLRRIEGQVRGLQSMIDDDRYCIDVLDQISATTRALQSVALEMVGDHISHCVVNAVQQGGAEKDAKIAEATAAIARLVKS
jgi:DNA-binding FrmR family transcriptional regulator